MSRFSGPQGKGAKRRLKERKRLDAEARDLRLGATDTRRRKYRLVTKWLEA